MVEQFLSALARLLLQVEAVLEKRWKWITCDIKERGEENKTV